MPHLTCATCKSASLKPPRMLAGAWYALCAQCLFETEVEPVDSAPGNEIPAPAAGAAGRVMQPETQSGKPPRARVA